MLEKEIEEYFEGQWRYRTRGECVKFPPLFYRGFPDRFCYCAPGWVFFIELKKPKGGVVSKVQDIVHTRLRGFGLRVEILYTKEMIDTFIDEICGYITNRTRTKTQD